MVGEVSQSMSGDIRRYFGRGLLAEVLWLDLSSTGLKTRPRGAPGVWSLRVPFGSVCDRGESKNLAVEEKCRKRQTGKNLGKNRMAAMMKMMVTAETTTKVKASRG